MQWTYETLQANKVIAISTNKIVGPAKFNGVSATELDATITSKTTSPNVAVLTKEYVGLSTTKGGLRRHNIVFHFRRL